MARVSRFKNILFVLAAMLWLPMSAHCQLEKIPGFTFLACVSDSDSPGKNSDCDDASCCAAEKSQYKPNQIRITIPTPDLLPLVTAGLPDIAGTLADEISAAAFAALPPELPKCWQFVFRTAAPPRAPSFAS